MSDEIRKVVNVIADAMPADPESYALDPDGSHKRDNARDILTALHAAGYEIVPGGDDNKSLHAEIANLEAKMKDDGRYLSALFQLLKEHSIEPASSDLIEAKKRADEHFQEDKAKMRAALEFYANPNSWRERFVNKGIGATISDARDDAGRCARATLQETQDQHFQEGVCGGSDDG